MRFAWSSAAKDFRRQLRDPASILIWIGIPLIIGLIIVLAFGGRSGPEPRAHVLVVDEDDSFISGFFISALGYEAEGNLIRTEIVEKDEGLLRIQEGDASALLLIPEGFGEALLAEDPDTLLLLTNPSQRILPNIVEEGLSMLVDGTFYLHRVIGEDLQNIAGGPPEGSSTFPDQQISTFSVRVNQLVGRVNDYLNPPLIELQTAMSEGESEEEDVNIGMLFLSGILFMSLLFMAQGISSDLWREREQRTLRRMAVSPQSLRSFLFGKVLCSAGFMLAVAITALLIGCAYFGLELTTIPLAAVWATISGVMLLTMLMLIQLFASSARGADILSLAIIFPLMMVGGSFFPFEAMPGWMAAIGTQTPNGWALEQLKAILMQRSDLESLGSAFIGIFVVTAMLFLVSVWRLRVKFVAG